MKKVFLSVVAMGLFVSGINAKSLNGNLNVLNGDSAKAKTATPAPAPASSSAIKPEELPAAVKATLATEEYKDWKATSASMDKDVYKVELKKGEATKTIKLNKEGKKVD